MSAGTDIKTAEQRQAEHMANGTTARREDQFKDDEIAELRAALEAAEGYKRKLAEMIKIAIEGMKPDSGRDAALYEAVAKFIKAKGRFHTEQNYAALVAAYDAAQQGEQK